MTVVVDTNVLVSALLSPSGAPAGVLNTILNGRATLLYDNRILFEYRDVLRRPRFQFPEPLVSPILDFVREAGQYVIADPTAIAFTDEDDKPFYEVAKSGGALFLITGNTNHFPDEPMVVTPRSFLDRLPSVAE